MSDALKTMKPSLLQLSSFLLRRRQFMWRYSYSANCRIGVKNQVTLCRRFYAYTHKMFYFEKQRQNKNSEINFHNIEDAA